MVEVRWTHQASDDLGSIVQFISKDSPQYARLFVSDVFQAVERLSEFPKSGRMVPELDDRAVVKSSSGITVSFIDSKRS